MQQFFDAAADYYVFTIIAVCVVSGMGFRALTTVMTTAARERSRREIAAYIAEGSLTADQGERLIRAEIDNRVNPAAC